MQFQGMEVFQSPDQELTMIPERASTVFPVTPAASKLTIPASRYAPLPPIESEHVADGDRDALVFSGRYDHQQHMQNIPVRTIGQVTMAEMVLSPRAKGKEKLLMQNEEAYGTREFRTRFVSVQDSNLGHEKDDDILGSDRKGDLESDKQKTVVKERTLTLEM